MIRPLKPFFGLPLIESLEEIKEASHRGYGNEFPTEKLCEYLRAGYMVEAWMGLEGCVLDPTHESTFLSTHTDGVWVWRYGVSHYVEAHAVRLDSEFLEHVKAMNFTLPVLTDQRLQEIEEDLKTLRFGPKMG